MPMAIRLVKFKKAVAKKSLEMNTDTNLANTMAELQEMNMAI